MSGTASWEINGQQLGLAYSRGYARVDLPSMLLIAGTNDELRDLSRALCGAATIVEQMRDES